MKNYQLQRVIYVGHPKHISGKSKFFDDGDEDLHFGITGYMVKDKFIADGRSYVWLLKPNEIFKSLT
jgi:hypothetical protein